MFYRRRRLAKQSDPVSLAMLGGESRRDLLVQQGEETPQGAVQKAERRVWTWVISLLLVGCLGIGLMLGIPQLNSVADRLSDANWGWVVFAIVLEILSCLCYVLTFKMIFTRATPKMAWQISWTQLAFAAVVPSGGASGIAVGAWVIKAKGGSLGRYVERSGVLYLVTSAMNTFSLAIFGLLAGFGVFEIRHPLLLGIVPGVVALATAGLVLLLWPLGKKIDQNSDRKLAGFLRGTGEVVEESFKYLIRPRWGVLAAIGYLWFDIFVLWAAFQAIGYEPTFISIVLAYLIGYLANLIPIPGGVGVLDGGIVGAFLLFGVKAAPATAAVLMYHAIVLWVPTVIGMIVFLQLRKHINEPFQLQITNPSGSSNA